MSVTRFLPAALCTAVLLVGWPLALSAAEPERLSATFAVSAATVGGAPEVDVAFTLAMSEISSYPVTITAISGTVEEKIWEGSLSEGVYRLRAPLKKISAGPLKVVLKTRITNRTADGNQTSIVYQKWEGTLGR